MNQAFIDAVNTFFTNLWAVGRAVAIPIAVVAIAWGGFLYMTSTGNVRRTEVAKATMLCALGGLFIILMAQLIANMLTAALPASPHP